MNAQNGFFSLRFVIGPISVNAQKRRCFSPFLYETEQCERVASMQQKRILTKTEQCERDLDTIGKVSSSFRIHRLNQLFRSRNFLRISSSETVGHGFEFSTQS